MSLFPSEPIAPCEASRTGPPRRGFALVVTVSVLVLLAVIAVGLLTLSTVTVRTSMQEEAVRVARANAKLALMLAIGELQKELGPDRRISARAEILDKTPATGEVDDVTNPHYLGVWDSWDTWLTDQKDSLSIQDTYKRGRHPSLFRTWLVSHPDAGDYQTALSATPAAETVVLCGERTPGSGLETEPVRAGRIPVRSGKNGMGSYAWWISDESQKARLDLKPRDDTNDIETAQIIASHTGRPGIETMTEMSDFDTTPENLDKMVTTGQARISADEASEHFHDLTAYSLGLLTDVRSGGFKRDLNLAFESDVVPEEMDEATLFGSRPFDAPIRPMTGELANIRPQNPYVAPMSWRQMREHYRVYREFQGSSKMHPIAWESGKPVTKRFLMGKRSMKGRWDSAGYARLPIMLRQTWIIATKTEANGASSSLNNRDYYVIAVPIVSLWNPYNAAMYLDSEEISYMGSMFFTVPLVQKTYRGANFLNETAFPDERTWAPGQGNPNGNITGNQLGYRMIPTERKGKIKFEPGEVRVFSTDDEIIQGVRLLDDPAAMDSRHFFASPGYTPVGDSDRGTLRGLKCRVNPGSGGKGALSMSLRLAEIPEGGRHYDPFWIAASSKSAMGFSFHEWRSASQGVYFEDGSLVGQHEWHDVVRLNMFSLDWLRTREVRSAWIVSDQAASRAEWPAPGSPPLPIGILSIVAKSPERLAYSASGGFAKDFRNRGWLHAPPTRMGCYLMNPTDLNRADSAYQLHFTSVNGDQEVSQYLEAEGRNGFFGGGYSRARGQTHVTALDLPVAPITNLGSLAGVRMDPARARIDQRDDRKASGADLPGRGYHNMKHVAHPGAAFGAGIGNAYAHPMIAPKEVYTRNDFGVDEGWFGRFSTQLAVCDDYWDHLFLANEELWDSWFCSGLAPVVNSGTVVTPKKTVAEDFFSSEPTLLSPNFQPYLRGRTPDELADLVEKTSSRSGANGWDVIGSHLLNRGQFNVNSTSREAWKALLMSLADRPLGCYEAGSRPVVRPREPDEVTLSRYPLANSTTAAEGPLDEHAWRGIRSLDEEEIDKLADEIVRQVKRRGPFLNMAEFINRRLSDDATGITGALQAAIDWDEFDAGYGGHTSGSGDSINKDYKGSEDMIEESDLPAAYPNPKAASGSRYAGIPGYVMQSDLLQGLASSLSVRGDTFLIRTSGESLTPDGQVAAQAWCEAVVQRMPEYVDPADAADKRMRLAGQLPDAAPNLTPLNTTFGRQFRIVSFRWLNENEI